MASPLTGVGLDADRRGLVPVFPGVAEGMGQGVTKPVPESGHEADHGTSSKQTWPQSWKTRAPCQQVEARIQRTNLPPLGSGT